MILAVYVRHRFKNKPKIELSSRQKKIRVFINSGDRFLFLTRDKIKISYKFIL